MAKLTEAKLRSWLRRAKVLDARAKKLMDDMTDVLGYDSINSDPIDNVTVATEDLISVLSRPELEMWGLKTPART